jgi:hypothetical protein
MHRACNEFYVVPAPMKRAVQHDGDEQTLCNDCDGIEPEVEGGGGITTAPAEQGSPVNEFLPIVGVSVVVGRVGETGTGGGWVTVSTVLGNSI